MPHQQSHSFLAYVCLYKPFAFPVLGKEWSFLTGDGETPVRPATSYLSASCGDPQFNSTVTLDTCLKLE